MKEKIKQIKNYVVIINNHITYLLKIQIYEEKSMAKIIETSTKRRMIKMTTDDILSVISQYQTLTNGAADYNSIRIILNRNNFYLPEDI